MLTLVTYYQKNKKESLVNLYIFGKLFQLFCLKAKISLFFTLDKSVDSLTSYARTCTFTPCTHTSRIFSGRVWYMIF